MFNIISRLITQNFFNKPIFVVGQGRSGTTALINAIGTHPQVLSVGFESPMISDIGNIVYKNKKKMLALKTYLVKENVQKILGRKI